jgi:ribosome biogenesis ATPase
LGEFLLYSPTYCSADLNALTAAAGILAVKRIFCSFHAEENISEDMQIDGQVEPVPVSPVDAITNFLMRHPDPLTEQQLEPLSIEMQDFVLALDKVQPSSKREGFATVPDVSWSDIGAMSTIRDELRMAIVEPIKHPELFAKVGISSPVGVLLWGPPGCGKTLLAKAIANESHCNFISVKGPELLNKVRF